MDGNGWSEHARIVRVDKLMGEWRRGLQYIRDMILDGTLTPLTLERRTPEGFLCGHVVDMGGFEPRPWKQFGAELEVYFDQNEIERIEREDPEVIAPPPPPTLTAPPRGAVSAPKASSAIRSPTAVPTPFRDLAEAHARIADLERQLEEAKQREEALVARMYELEANTAEPNQWHPSFKAVCMAYAEAFESGRGDWNKDTDFKALVEKHFTPLAQGKSLLVEALRFAWKTFPQRMKAGPGSPGTQPEPANPANPASQTEP